MNSVPTVCKWLLDRNPQIVHPLSRGQNGLLAYVEKDTRLNLPNTLFTVPQLVEVYSVLRGFSRTREEYYFVCRNDLPSIESVAYLSHVKLTPDFKSRWPRGLGNLLEFPWYSLSDSSQIFQRLTNPSEASFGKIFKDTTEMKGIHPLLIDLLRAHQKACAMLK